MNDKERLASILETMDVPQMRRNLDDESNIMWLNRNLLIRNNSNPNIEEAMNIIRKLLIS